MITKMRCPKCGHEVYRNARGEVLRHTTPARGGRTRGTSPWSRAFSQPPVTHAYEPAEVCPGSTAGARP